MGDCQIRFELLQFRNTTAHAPKITWSIQEQDALDILSMVSLVHRRLDDAIEAQKMYQGKS
ncbi:TIGR02391 family protein [Xenorhabdus budapestensis]|uniref:TIGR02391 family protein n=1 Tax=Xenorhabdus budapestensis TaxID=290110 RepID=UPI001FD1CC1F|nr:TIGR02391 family protein [Xenorhabdus budapestensis]